MASPLLNYEAGFRQAISDELNDMTKTAHTVTGLMLGFDTYYNQPDTRFKRSDQAGIGTELQVDLLMARPAVAGITAKTGNLAAQVLTRAKNFSTQAGKQPWSYYAATEAMYKSHLKILSKNPPALADYQRKIAKSMVDAWNTEANDDLFRVVALTPTVGQVAEDKVMAFGFPLQSGYADNEPTGSGTYLVYSIDLNQASAPDNTIVKAVQAGSVASGFGVFSPSNVRTKLLYPLQARGISDSDLGIVPADVMDYMVSTAEAKLLIDMADKLNYGAEIVRYCGKNWVIEHRLDAKYAAVGNREAYLIRTADFCWHSYNWGSGMDWIEKVPDAPTLSLLQGWGICALTCEAPRNQAHAFKITLS